MNPQIIKKWDGAANKGLTVLQDYEREGSQGAVTRWGRGTSSPFPVPSISPMITAEDRRAEASQATRCHLWLDRGRHGVTVRESEGGATELRFSN